MLFTLNSITVRKLQRRYNHGLTFLGLTESPSIDNKYADTTMMDELFNYARSYVSTTVKVKFLLKFNSRADFKLAKARCLSALHRKAFTG